MNKSPMSFTVAIAQRGKGEKAAAIFGECGINVLYIGLGHGTANSEIMDYLGLDEPEKDIVFGVCLTDCVSEAFSRLGDEMGFMGRGTGIAFSLPVTSATQGTAERVGLTTDTERSGVPMDERFEMIVVFVDKGMTDIAMDSAKAAGARGGTILKCRDMNPDSERRVFGVTVHRDMEMLMLITPKKDKDRIMKAICDTVYSETEQHAVAFSAVIDDVVGLR